MYWFRVAVGMYWYGYYGVDDMGNEYPISSNLINQLKEEI